MLKLLNQNFFLQDSKAVAKLLIGCVLETKKDGHITRTRITETEAYPSNDAASHAFGHKVTPRTSTQYMKGGILYIYLIRGLHIMTSFVVNEVNTADVVFIRSVEPIEGTEIMLQRRRKTFKDIKNLTSGPGRLSSALGISMRDNGQALNSDHSDIYVYSDDTYCPKIKSGQRINLGFKRGLAEKDIKLARNAKLRFFDNKSTYLSC